MKTKIVTYIDEDDVAYLAQVPINSNDPESGIILGPPDELSDLNIPVDKLKLLRRELVEAGWYMAPQLMNKREELFRIVRKLELSHPKQVVREILHIYQADFYKVNNGE